MRKNALSELIWAKEKHTKNFLFFDFESNDLASANCKQRIGSIQPHAAPKQPIVVHISQGGGIRATQTENKPSTFEQQHTFVDTNPEYLLSIQTQNIELHHLNGVFL